MLKQRCCVSHAEATTQLWHFTAFKTLPTLEYELVTESGGEPGWMGTWHKHESDESMTPVEEPFEQRLIDETNIFVNTSTPGNITRKWTLRLRGQLKPRPYGVDFEFGLSTAGRAKVSGPSPSQVFERNL